jgi:hypothetical protein
MWDEKKTAPRHIRLTPSVYEAALDSARRDGRPLQDQLLWLLREALQDRGYFGNESMVRDGSGVKQNVAQQELPMAAPVRIVAERSSAKRRRA